MIVKVNKVSGDSLWAFSNTPLTYHDINLSSKPIFSPLWTLNALPVCMHLCAIAFMHMCACVESDEKDVE